jgi:hypothetical protein
LFLISTASAQGTGSRTSGAGSGSGSSSGSPSGGEPSAHEEKQVGEMPTKTFDPGEVIFREGDESQVSFLQDG